MTVEMFGVEGAYGPKRLQDEGLVGYRHTAFGKRAEGVHRTQEVAR
jgi:hypothetical protein